MKHDPDPLLQGMTLEQWACRLGYQVGSLKNRIRLMPLEQALRPNQGQSASGRSGSYRWAAGAKASAVAAVGQRREREEYLQRLRIETESASTKRRRVGP